LVAAPKRVVKETEVAWQPVEQPNRKPGKRYRAQNARIIRVRLLALDSRDSFLLVGTSNGSFSFTLKWQDYDLARIDCGERHHLPKMPGELDKYVYGPHVHYFVAGHGLDYARETGSYSFHDVNGSLRFFLQHCGVVDVPPVQEALRFV
jgi:hypothetical protein